MRIRLFAALILLTCETARAGCPDPAWDEMREMLQGAPAAALGGIGSCKNKYGEIHVDDLMSFNRSACSMTKINLNSLSDTNQTLTNWAAETAVFQEMARRSHGEAVCRVGFFDRYDADLTAQKSINSKANAAFNAQWPDLKKLILYRNQLVSQLRDLDNEASDRAVGSLTRAGRDEYRRDIDDVNELITNQLTKVPLGYDPDVERALLKMAEQGSFDTDAFKKAVDSASQKHRAAAAYYQSRAIPVSTKSINYCLGKDYRDQAGKLGNVTALLDSLPEPQFDRHLKAKIMCRLDARYGAGADRLSKAELVAFVASLAYTGAESLAYRGVKLAAKVVEASGAAAAAGTLQAVGTAGMVDSLEKSCFDDDHLITPTGQDTCDTTKMIQQELDGPDHSKCAVQGVLTAAPIAGHILKFLRESNTVGSLVVHSDDVAKSAQLTRGQLNAMGANYRVLKVDTRLGDDAYKGNVTIVPSANGAVEKGDLYLITRLPQAAAKVTKTTPALENPEMASYFEKLKEMGYRLVVDSSLPHTKSSSYHWADEKLIAIEHDTDWPTFLKKYKEAEKAYKAEHRIDYTPIVREKSVNSTDVVKSTVSARAQLDKMGVKYSEVEVDTHLRNAELRGETTVKPDDDGIVDDGQVLEVTGLPKPRATGNVNTPAFSHPEMADYMNRLKQMGYRVVVDTSLNHTGAGGYMSPTEKFIAMEPDSTWQTFVHEYQHLEFQETIEPNFAKWAEAKKTTGATLESVVDAETKARIGPKKLARLEQLMDRELPRLAVNETLSSDAELRAMGFRRYSPAESSPEKYTLRHQVNELQKLSKRTPIQEKTLKEAKARYSRILRYEKYGPKVIGGTGITAAGGALTYVAVKIDKEPSASAPIDKSPYEDDDDDDIPPAEQDPNSYKTIVVDQAGTTYAKKPDGGWVALHKPH